MRNNKHSCARALCWSFFGSSSALDESDLFNFRHSNTGSNHLNFLSSGRIPEPDEEDVSSFADEAGESSSSTEGFSVESFDDDDNDDEDDSTREILSRFANLNDSIESREGRPFSFSNEEEDPSMSLFDIEGGSPIASPRSRSSREWGSQRDQSSNNTFKDHPLHLSEIIEMEGNESQSTALNQPTEESIQDSLHVSTVEVHDSSDDSSEYSDAEASDSSEYSKQSSTTEDDHIFRDSDHSAQLSEGSHSVVPLLSNTMDDHNPLDLSVESLPVFEPGTSHDSMDFHASGEYRRQGIRKARRRQSNEVDRHENALDFSSDSFPLFESSQPDLQELRAIQSPKRSSEEDEKDVNDSDPANYLALHSFTESLSHEEAQSESEDSESSVEDEDATDSDSEVQSSASSSGSSEEDSKSLSVASSLDEEVTSTVSPADSPKPVTSSTVKAFPLMRPTPSRGPTYLSIFQCRKEPPPSPRRTATSSKHRRTLFCMTANDDPIGGDPLEIQSQIQAL